MKKYFTKEVRIALAAILSGLVLFAGIDYLKGINVLKASNYYYARYTNVTGLTVSTPVKIDGFNVGLVRSIQYDYARPGNIVVEVSLNDQLRVPTGSRLVLSTDFMGTAMLALQTPPDEMHYCQPGDTLTGINAADLMGSLQNELLPQVNALLPKIDSILTGLNRIVQHPGIAASLDRMDRITANLESSATGLNRILRSDLPPILNNVSSLTANLDRFSGELNRIDLARTASYVDSTLIGLQGVTRRLTTPDNSLGLLMTDPHLYYKLVQAAGSADSLLVDLRLHPKRYVHFSLFGRKN